MNDKLERVEQREKRIERVLKYLKIDDPYEDDDESLYNLLDVYHSDEENIFEICRLIVDKQQEIFLKTGTLVPLNEIIKKAIIRGLDVYRC